MGGADGHSFLPVCTHITSTITLHDVTHSNAQEDYVIGRRTRRLPKITSSSYTHSYTLYVSVVFLFLCILTTELYMYLFSSEEIALHICCGTYTTYRDTLKA